MNGRVAMLCVMAAVGCSTVLGLDDYRDKPSRDGGAGAGGAAGVGGSGGTSGVAGVDAGGAGNGGDSGEVDAPDAAPPPDLGRPCVGDDECGSGLFCVTHDSGLFGGGSPAKGYCTAQCLNHEFCQAISPSSFCIQYPGSSFFCREGCSLGPPNSSNINPNKCHGRVDVACMAYDSPTLGVCQPTCGHDGDCASGQYCHLSDGLCRDFPPTGNPIGSDCSVDPTTCAGLCVDGYCTGMCPLNVSRGCGWLGPGSTTAQAACLTASPDVVNYVGAGDLGYCIALCDCNEHCPKNGDICQPLPPAQATLYGRFGVCIQNVTGGPGTPCP